MEEKKLNHIATVYLVKKITRDLTISSEVKIFDVDTRIAVRIIENAIDNSGKYEVKKIDFPSEIKEAETVYKYVRNGLFEASCEVRRIQSMKRTAENSNTIKAAIKETKSREKKFKEAVEIVKAAIEDYYNRLNKKS